MTGRLSTGPFCLIGVTVLFCSMSLVAHGQVTFAQLTIDVNAGDLKLAGDIDLDGTVDVVLGGSPGENLNWYHYPTWTKTVLAIPYTEFTTDGELGDVDGDGDLDIVTPDGSGSGNLRWFENPIHTLTGPKGDPFQGTQWTQHTIGTIGSWGKDVELADFDENGLLDVATRSNGESMIFFQTGQDTWIKVLQSVSNLGYEGMSSGDIDGDGDVDLVHCGSWHRNPGKALARDPAKWNEFVIDAATVVASTFKALVIDVNQNGIPDVLFSCSEATAPVVWCEPTSGDPTDVWTIHTIEPALNKAHTLQAGDIDRDDDIDVVVGQMHTSTTKELSIYFNLDGSGNSWFKQVIDSGSGVHNGVVADIGADGDLDVVGANWTGNPPLRHWENLIPASDILFHVGPVVAGQSTLLRATNCVPGTPAYMVASFYPAIAPYYFSYLNVTIELGLPFFLLAATPAGANGVADLVVTVPTGLPPATFWIQTLQPGTVSNIEVVQLP